MTVRVRAQMPGDGTETPVKPIASNRGWWIGAGGLVFLMAWSAVEMIRDASHPSGYRGRHWDVAVDGPWPFPADEVRTWLLVMLAQGLFGLWWLGKRSTTSLGVRALAYGLLMFGGFVCMIPFAMHASAPFPQYLGWAFLASAWSVVFACACGCARVLGKGG